MLGDHASACADLALLSHMSGQIQPSLEQITVADLVRFLLWLPADEREKVVDLLRAIQDRRWHETGLEPVIISEAQEEAR